MSWSTAIRCDKVMDEYGSTCGRHQLFVEVDREAREAAAAALGWAVGGIHGGALCPMHSGLGLEALLRRAPVTPIRRPSTRSDATVTPLPSRRDPEE